MYLTQLLLCFALLVAFFLLHLESNVNFFTGEGFMAMHIELFSQRKNFAKLKSCSEYIFTFQCEEEMRYEMLIDHIK